MRLAVLELSVLVQPAVTLRSCQSWSARHQSQHSSGVTSCRDVNLQILLISMPWWLGGPLRFECPWDSSYVTSLSAVSFPPPQAGQHLALFVWDNCQKVFPSVKFLTEEIWCWGEMTGPSLDVTVQAGDAAFYWMASPSTWWIPADPCWKYFFQRKWFGWMSRQGEIILLMISLTDWL